MRKKNFKREKALTFLMILFLKKTHNPLAFFYFAQEEEMRNKKKYSKMV